LHGKFNSKCSQNWEPLLDSKIKCFANWWAKAVRKVKKECKKEINSLIILTAWIIWKHHNACVS
jgi:hypothetical protein